MLEVIPDNYYSGLNISMVLLYIIYCIGLKNVAVEFSFVVFFIVILL